MIDAPISRSLAVTAKRNDRTVVCRATPKSQSRNSPEQLGFGRSRDECDTLPRRQQPPATRLPTAVPVIEYSRGAECTVRRIPGEGPMVASVFHTSTVSRARHIRAEETRQQERGVS